MLNKFEKRYAINGWLFILPALTMVMIFTMYPVINSLWMSFQVGIGVNTKFGGLSNIRRLFDDPIFFKALLNTLLFLIVQVPVMLALALFMAVLLNESTLKLRGFFRTAIFLPTVTSLVAYAILFKSMFSLDGIINTTLQTFWIISKPIDWQNDPFWAKFLIIIAITWRWTGYNMIFFLAALQNIDKSIYEASIVDGVSAKDRFLYITIPLVKPVILFETVTSTIGTLQLFDEVKNLTNGGPGDATITLSMYIYKLIFAFSPSFGYAATVSYVVVFIVALLTYIQFKFAKNKD